MFHADSGRKAVAERRVIQGMTPDQVYCALGQATRKEKGRENGARKTSQENESA
jgi:hypothetical protein